MASASKRRSIEAYAVPAAHDWRTTDEQETARRRERARMESFQIVNLDTRHRVFSNFRVTSRSGMAYSVEIRDIQGRQFACECIDFRINGLGTCKHVEAVLNLLEARHKRLFRRAVDQGSDRLDVILDRACDTLRLVAPAGRVPRSLAGFFARDGLLLDPSPEDLIPRLESRNTDGCPTLRISQEVRPWLLVRQRACEQRELRREYELRVQSGEWPAHETTVPLFPYQREGMLHLAFAERALLADEMGLGKTIQAIAACALLHRLGTAQHVLVVTPASLKTEWEDQIRRFTALPFQLLFGGRHTRLRAYAHAPFFTIANYEQIRADSLDVNQVLKPDVVILDEAQRIKNWTAKTSQAVKRLRSRYAFVLTGTPIENRIDELYSLMDFLDPTVLGPLFRFNREYYELDERGRPAGYRNLDQLRERIRPSLLRRRKAEVETELPDRTDRNHFVPLSGVQQTEYDAHQAVVARLAFIAKRRQLSPQEQDKLLRHLNMMRMVCDTLYILTPDDTTCPKLAELEKLLEECQDNDLKVLVFSEWERMLELVRDLCRRLGIGFAWHTGTVPQKRRRAEINLFKQDPQCRVFLSTESGAAGLNLQNASVVINCDLPWNPAKLEQRIARAWRKHQTRPVTVVNLVSEHTIEERMLATLADKQSLAQGVLDQIGNLKEIKLRSGRQALLARLEQLAVSAPGKTPTPLPPQRVYPADRPLGFAREIQQRLGVALVRCEERFPAEGAHSVLCIVVDRDAPQWREQLTVLHQEYFGPGQTDPLAPVQLEILDRATDEALTRLVAAGLVTTTLRATRALFPGEAGTEPGPALSPADLEKIAAHRALADRKLKMASLLASGGLLDEARAAAIEAVVPLARALAVAHRLPEPASSAEALRSPLAVYWRQALPFAQSLLEPAGTDFGSALRALTQHTASLFDAPKG